MNKLVLIGNGFDIAHGLKTRYSDFILWYFNSAYEECKRETKYYEDDLLRIEFTLDFFVHDYFNSLDHFFKRIEEYEITIIYKNDFIQNIVEMASIGNWVDIESEYFSSLKEVYEYYERQGNKYAEKRLRALNVCFNQIKELLIRYLSTIDQNSIVVKPHIRSHFQKMRNDLDSEKDRLLLINFNYTSTIDLYDHALEMLNHKIINIHGTINQENNPIIFGYGDEMDPYYEKIENINNNDYLKYMKSFGYYNTSNYQDISRFVEDDDFEAYIMGHSCGISDRILLNSIFENDNCKCIRIFYHQRQDGSNDFFEKTQELSRHFKPLNKNSMRTKIISIDKCKPLISNLV